LASRLCSSSARCKFNLKRREGHTSELIIRCRSVAAAIARTALSFVYSESADVTYNFSKAGIFILLEMTAAFLVFTIPTAPKPLKYLAKQAGSSVSRLIGSNSSGSGGRRPYVTGSENPRANANQGVLDNRRQPPPLAKPRVVKKQSFVRSSTAYDEEAEVELGVIEPSTSRVDRGAR
jgi:hypothetical protein